MSSLFYKAWIETRVRFFAGLVAASIVCIYHIHVHAWQVEMWTREMQNPKGYHLAWMPLGIHNYGWYLWQYLYNNYLQQVWALFAVLFTFGGLMRERSSGTVLFSLGLPVSRRNWLFSRLIVALLESVALSLFAVAVVVAA
jgi:ABC-2 family transporter protein